MKKEIYTPHAYFINIKKVTELISQLENKQLSAKELAEKLNFSPNYIFQTTRTMDVLKLLEKFGGEYKLSENGKLLSEYLHDNNYDKLKELGEMIIFNPANSDVEALRKAYNKLKENPNISDYELGNYIANEFGIVWKTQSTYEKVGGSCKSILKGFNIIGEQKLKLDYENIKTNNNIILGNLFRYSYQFLGLVSENNNAWKNHIDLRQKIEKSIDKIIENQNEFLIKDYIKTSKKILKEGFITQNINYIRDSIEIIARLDYHNLIK